MRALFYGTNEIKEDNIVWGLIELSVDVSKSELIPELDDIVNEQVEAIALEVREYDFVITRNFCVNVAEGCNIAGVMYIAWSYDSPLRALYRKEAFYPTNRIFVFDKKHLERLNELGLDHIYYQPLVANVARASLVSISDDDIAFYDRDVSFVGSMYVKGFYDAFAKVMPEKIVRECEGVFDRHLCRWDKGSTIFDELSDDAINELYSKINKEGRDLYSISDRFLTEYLVLVVELTSRERVKLLNTVSDRFNTVVHTYDPEMYKGMIKAELRPPLLPLSDEMFRIYAASKININITMRSIETGIPQRVYDIMSVGGCVFSNYQEEAEELFEPDKEIVLFKSLEEFMDKADYYIRHEKERLELGARAYLRVRNEYNYPNALKNMMDKL